MKRPRLPSSATIRWRSFLRIGTTPSLEGCCIMQCLDLSFAATEQRQQSGKFDILPPSYRKNYIIPGTSPMSANTMRIQELKMKFQNGEYSKPHFLELMFEKHKVLFEYAEEIGKTDLSEISITSDGVCFTSREHGIKFLCPAPDCGIAPIGMFNLGSYEKAEADMCLSLIQPGDTIFDVGANVGWFSTLISKNIESLTIHAFEPIGNTFNILNKNLELNGISSISTYNFGFYTEKTELTFFYDSECSGKTSAANLAEKEVSEITCKLETMDDFVAHHSITALDFVKCDVEGAEFFVYKGGLETLKRFKPMIFSEMLRKWAAKFDYHPNEVIKMLSGIGYSCFVIREGSLVRFATMDENTIETNYIFLHDERHANLIKDRVAA